MAKAGESLRWLEVTTQVKLIKACWEKWGLVVSLMTIRGDTGYPDLIIWLPGGKPLLMELKREGFSPESKQVFIHKQLRKLGYEVEVCDTLSSAIQAIAKAVAALTVHEKSGEVPIGARGRRSVLRPRDGQDKYNTGSHQPTTESKKGK